MKEKITIALLLFAFAGATLSMTAQVANSYGESEGGWSATEKRQVISLLEKIEKNTRR